MARVRVDERQHDDHGARCDSRSDAEPCWGALPPQVFVYWPGEGNSHHRFSDGCGLVPPRCHPDILCFLLHHLGVYRSYPHGHLGGILELLGDVVVGCTGGDDHRYATNHPFVGVEMLPFFQAACEAARVCGDWYGDRRDFDHHLLLQRSVLPAITVFLFSSHHVYGLPV